MTKIYTEPKRTHAQLAKICTLLITRQEEKGSNKSKDVTEAWYGGAHGHFCGWPGAVLTGIGFMVANGCPKVRFHPSVGRSFFVKSHCGPYSLSCLARNELSVICLASHGILPLNISISISMRVEASACEARSVFDNGGILSEGISESPPRQWTLPRIAVNGFTQISPIESVGKSLARYKENGRVARDFRLANGMKIKSGGTDEVKPAGHVLTAKKRRICIEPIPSIYIYCAISTS